ncbi:hypothetical protein DM01DRAFT_1206052 [Hesseltinella vesiculosa]|uniref:Uncharacterized protein n=1 Tax=Hesseltinella vesiculosa TaxID=101127 RepID=A0A1X2GPS6_9FUNG|nr:hypothetical protein DM01DRAFT_1206052 [Hesseltinella vesiculosa]
MLNHDTRKQIDMIDNDTQDSNTKKRAIDYLKEGISLLTTCKRRYVSSPSPSPTPQEVNPLEANGPAPTPLEASDPAPETSGSATEKGHRNWQYIEAYMEQLAGDSMNWKACFFEGSHQGFFKTYSTPASLKNAYNRWKNNQ